MEEKPAGSYVAVGAGADSPVSVEPTSSRRRAGGQKRKVNAVSTLSSSSTPSKRLTREKAAISHPPIHNGPLTRARQSPNNLASSASTVATGLKREEVAAAALEIAAAAVEEEKKSKLEKLEAAIEAEFEAIRSRDSDAHAVPTHCGWFSWTKIHPLEQRVLPSFFDGKSQIRTPDTYMEIRNWIMKKFHADPKTQIELKDLSDLEVADLDARQEVLEFLDYWGLINFQPFQQIDSKANADGDGAAKKDSSLEKLFRFEDIQPCLPVVSNPNFATPAMSSGLFPESAIPEELMRPEGPSVEYHCNSCSADCSRKRYHCQKQADYDLCADCFNIGKFGSNMSSSDFILMEPAEAPGASGGKWTDQETLLLLEALELYKENWNEIAEHVATKTKAQCILHFVQMPIEDTFFDCNDDVDGSSKETGDPAALIDETSAPKDAPESSEGNVDAKENQPQTSPTEASKSEEINEVKICPDTTKSDNACELITVQEISKTADNSEVRCGQETRENVALKALTEAFEAVGYLPTSQNQLSFAEVGNSVMLLAAFFGKLVGPDVATASARNSLKSLSSNAPGIQLAARHCFILEDPPDDRKEQAGFDCVDANNADRNACISNHRDENQKWNNSTSSQNDKKNEDYVPEETKPQDSSEDKSTEKVNAAKEVGTAVMHEEVEPGQLKESNNSELPKDHSLSIIKKSDAISSKLQCPPSSVKELQEGCSVGDYSQLEEAAMDVDMVSASKPSEKNEPCQLVPSKSVEDPSKDAEASNDADKVSDSLLSKKDELQQPMISNSMVEHSEPTDAPNDVDMLPSLLSEANELRQPVTPNSVIEHGVTAAEDEKGLKKEKPDCKEIKDDYSIDKLKRAAVSALSAAAVKAKLLAGEEENQIQQLAALLIEKQLHKLEMKLAFFNEMDGVIMRVREQLDRKRQRLYHERAQIIAARLGLPASSARAMPPSLPSNRISMNLANSVPRPPMSMTSQRPPFSRPTGTLSPSPNPSVSTMTASSIQPSVQDNLSSVGMK